MTRRQGGGGPMRCTACRAPAVLDVRRHNAAFCGPCLVEHCRDQVRRAIRHFGMLRPDDRVLVAVSGGKDSLALWDLLVDLGYRADGLYLGLGIAGYSEDSVVHAREFAARRELHLIEVDLPGEHGFDVPGAAAATRRAPCGACGLSKRHLFNDAALRGGYDAVATGHNLDDEAAVLFGNVLRWDAEYLARQHPVLPARAGFARKVKPLVRMGEREMAAYCIVRRIDYQVDECPMAEGNRHLGYKELLNDLESRSPGSKAAFLHRFLDTAHARFADASEQPASELRECGTCGAPTPGDVCAFCRLKQRVADKAASAGPVPVALRARG